MFEEMGAVGAGLGQALSEVAAVDVGVISDVELLAGVQAMAAAEAALRAVQARWLRAAEARQSTVAERGRATRSWLVEELRMAPAEARRRMWLARPLGDAPVTQAAFDAGEISAEHAVTITRAVHDVAESHRPAVDAALGGLARHATPPELARAVDEVRVRLGIDDSAEAAYARRHAQRAVQLATTFGGTGSLAGTLTAEVTETLRLALEAAATGDRPGLDDQRSPRQRRHDALGALAAFYLAHTDDADPVAGERPRVVVTLDHATLRAQLTAQAPTLDSGTQLSPETARRIACDAEILPAVLGTRCEVLDLGRTRRAFSTAIRRAAWLTQHGRCAYPACRRRPADCHHIIWWSTGGPTSQDNAAWLCAFHHRLVHDGGWTMHRDPTGDTFTSPAGITRHQPRQPKAA